jgi:glutaredoxin
VQASKYTTCPRCQYARKPQDDNPDWQCPSCGVCYAKVALGAQPDTRGAARAAAAPQSQGWDIPWGKLLLLLVAVLAFAGAAKWRGGAHTLLPQGEPSVEQIRALAAAVSPGDVVMYSTTECVYCAQAKSWLQQYGFVYTECNMSVDQNCITEFNRYGANGTPFLVVRGHQMHNGFGTDEFISILQQPPS